jgi:hypothetical protein
MRADGWITSGAVSGVECKVRHRRTWAFLLNPAAQLDWPGLKGNAGKQDHRIITLARYPCMAIMLLEATL